MQWFKQFSELDRISHGAHVVGQSVPGGRTRMFVEACKHHGVWSSPGGACADISEETVMALYKSLSTFRVFGINFFYSRQLILLQKYFDLIE